MAYAAAYVQIVVQGVVAHAGVGPGLDVVVFAARLAQDGLNLPAEVSLHLHHQPVELPFRVAAPRAQQPVQLRIHARGGLAGADGAKDHHAGIQPALGNGQPLGARGGAGPRGVVGLANDH